MSLLELVDDIVWSDVTDVWSETYFLVLRQARGLRLPVQSMMKWALGRMREFEEKYQKVDSIHRSIPYYSHGIGTLSQHYHRIMTRYRSVHSACQAVVYSM